MWGLFCEAGGGECEQVRKRERMRERDLLFILHPLSFRQAVVTMKLSCFADILQLL